MASFTYTALDSEGRDVRGQVDAIDRNKAFSELKARGLSPLSVKQKVKGSSFTALRRITTKDQAMMVRQLAVLLSAGVTLIDAMKSLANGSSHPILAERAAKVVANLRAGERFPQNLAQEFPTLPAYVAQMAELGETTGRLGPALTEAADQLDYDQEIASQVRSALTYPIFLVVAGSSIIALMFLFVVPRFAELLSQSNAEIPLISRVVIEFSLWFKENLLLAILGLIAIAVTVWLLLRNSRGGFSGLVERVPLIRKYQAVSTLARWCRTLGGALEHGAGLLPAMELAERSVSAPKLRTGLALARQSVRSGDALDEAIARNMPDFDSVAIDMIRTGRTSGQLSEMLLFAADIYRRETQERTKRLTALVEPIAIVSISLAVGTIVISIVLAMTSLYEIAP